MTRQPFKLLLAILLLLLASCFIVVEATQLRRHLISNEEDDTSTQKSTANDKPIVAHVLPHSHCDAAYKKTLQEYYETEVRNVLNSILIALPKDSSRRFVWAETVFLEKWWNDARTTQQQRQAFASLVSSNQLELVCGGWVMHDEAITRYDSQIHQMTHGHAVLQSLLNSTNITIKTGYQIDPFGASSFSVLLHKWAGMNMILHNRIPHKDLWKLNQSLEFEWQATPQDGIWTHVYDDHYETRGYDWESLETPAEPVTEQNVQEFTEKYIQIVREKSNYYKSRHVLMPFGGDFRFQNASWQFTNMDMIVKFANENKDRYPNIVMKYTTVQEYNDAVHQESSATTFPVVEGSPFLPLWTGFYSTLPALKQMLRSCEMLLRIVETQFAKHDFVKEIFKLLQSARETVFLMQHHDAITGTSYRFVILDYWKRMKQCMDTMTRIITSLLLDVDSNESHCEAPEGRVKLVGGGPYLYESLLVRDTDDARSIHLERILDPLMGSNGISLVVLNSLAWQVDTLVSFVCSRSDVGIITEDGKKVPSQATPLENELDVANLGLFLITFRATIPPLGQSRFKVKVCDLTWDTFQDPPEMLPSIDCAHVASTLTRDDVMQQGISSDILHVQFDSQTNDVTSVAVTDSSGEQQTWELSQDIILYDGSNDDLYNMNTAIEDSDPPPLAKSCKIISAYKGPLFSEVTVEMSPWLSTRYRVVNGTDIASMLHVSVLAGTIPQSTNVASRFATDLSGATAWGYDENGFLSVKASYDSTQGVGNNLRPMVSRAWLEEPSSSSSNGEAPPRFTIYTVDPRGVVSRHVGSLDVFWHRRNIAGNDWQKHGDDKSTIRSSVFLSFPNGGQSDAESKDRKLATLLGYDVALFAAPESLRHLTTTVQNVLPDHMHLVSFRRSGRAVGMWVDLQIENLSSGTTNETSNTVDLVPLLQEVPDVGIENATLSSLTYLYADNESTKEACRLIDFEGGELYLSIAPRRICSVRVPI